MSRSLYWFGLFTIMVAIGGTAYSVIDGRLGGGDALALLAGIVVVLFFLTFVILDVLGEKRVLRKDWPW